MPRAESGRLAEQKDRTRESATNWDRFAVYRAGVTPYSPDEAAEWGLTPDQIRAIELIVWETRQRLNQAFAEVASVSRAEDGAVRVSVQLDEATAARFRAETVAALDDALGDEKSRAFQSGMSMRLLDTALDGFGAAKITYTLKPRKTGNIITLEAQLVRSDRPGVVRTTNHAFNVFQEIYGPLAGKAGF